MQGTQIAITNFRGSAGKSTVAKWLSEYINPSNLITIHAEPANLQSLPGGVQGQVQIFSEFDMGKLVEDVKVARKTGKHVVVDVGASMFTVARATQHRTSELLESASAVVIPTSGDENGFSNLTETMRFLDAVDVIRESIIVCIVRAESSMLNDKRPSSEALDRIQQIHDYCESMGIAVAKSFVINDPIIAKTHSTNQLLSRIVQAEIPKRLELARIARQDPEAHEAWTALSAAQSEARIPAQQIVSMIKEIGQHIEKYSELLGDPVESPFEFVGFQGE